MANKITHTAKKRSKALSGAMLLVAGVNLGSFGYFLAGSLFLVIRVEAAESWWFFFKWKKLVGKKRGGGMKQRLGKE